MILGDFENWLVCTNQQSLIELFNGRFSEVFKIEKHRIKESEMNGYTAEAKAAKTSNLHFILVVMMVHILQGDLVDALSEYENMHDTYREVNPALRAQYQAIFSHLELHKDDLFGAMSCLERIVELIPRIHYTNNSIYPIILLSILAMFSAIEKSKARSEKERKRHSIGGLLNIEDYPKISKRASVISNVGGKKPGKVGYVVKSVRGLDGSLTFDYISTKNLKTGPVSSKQSVQDQIQQQVKKISYDIVAKLAPFQRHILCEPFLILLKALAKMCDPNIVNNAATADGPHVLRNWVQKQIQVNPKNMKLVHALLGIKCWTVSHDSLEYITDLNLGMAILAELGLDGLSIF